MGLQIDSIELKRAFSEKKSIGKVGIDGANKRTRAGLCVLQRTVTKFALSTC